MAAFDRAGGRNYQGNKVPLEQGDDGHWRNSVFQNEVMCPTAGIGHYLSEETLGAFEDLGYEVDYSQADAYRLPRQAAKTVSGSVDGHEHHESWQEKLKPIEGIH